MRRNPRPWYRRANLGWYVTLNGKQIPLGVFDPDDKAGAEAAVQKLLDERAEASKPKPPPPTGPTETGLGTGGFLGSNVGFASAIAALGEGLARVAAELGHRGDPSKDGGTTSQRLPPPVQKIDWPGRVEAFLAGRAHLDPETLTLYRHHLGRAVKHLTDPPDIDAIIRSCLPTWRDSSRRNYLMTVQTFLRWCGHKVSIRKPGMESAGAKRLIPEDVYQKVLNATGHVPDFRALLTFLWNTGCRPSEAYKLTAPDVDWSSGTIRLKKHKTKHKGKQRIIYLCPTALEVLTAQRDKHPEGLLFPNRSKGQWNASSLSSAMWRLSKRLKHKIVAYGCRHTYCTRALEKGVPDTHVAALMGHSSTEMIHKHYSHLSENARLLKDAAARVSAPAEGQAGIAPPDTDKAGTGITPSGVKDV